MNSYKNLLEQREALDRQIAEARRVELADAIAKVREIIAQYGLTEADVFAGRKARATVKSSNPVAPKYRDPATGSTWTGRGKPPLWISGKDRAQFEIK
ncbi:histone (plasmid) [Acidovorax carolinensis]|uniref:Histone n=1 Tax=Acidovorax carolinensis TaxID=553814 RepID=A0A240UIE1_9BURK|nr:H-NS histone family protein [Acidovorax carolinensis]ART57218.1 histone [Acidovorax carolinensis]ART61274.1 histone [Acidovorax carolinensis]